MDISKRIDFDTVLSIKLSGDMILNILKSDMDHEYVTIFSQQDLSEYTIELTSSVIKVIDNKIKAAQADMLNKAIKQVDFNHGLKEILVSGIHAAKSLLHEAEKSHRCINVTLFIKDNFENIGIKADNLEFNIKETISENVTINAANLEINTLETNNFNDLSIKSSNIKGNIFFGEKVRKIMLRSNNGKFNLHRQAGFSGLVDFTGNNIKIQGDIGNSSEQGVCNVFLNNGKVTITDCKINLF